MKKLSLLFSFNLFLLKRLISFSMASFVKSCISLALLILLGVSSQAQNVGDYRNKNGADADWSALSTWERYNGTTWAQPSAAQGYPGQFSGSPTVTIVNRWVTTRLNVSPTNPIGSLVFEQGNVPSTLQFTGTNSLLVEGDIVLNVPTANNNHKALLVDAGSVSCSSLILNGGNDDRRDSYVRISTGSVVVLTNLEMNGVGRRAYVLFNGAGSLNVGGGITGGNITSTVGGDNTSAPTSGTVNYNGTVGSQTFGAYNYYNLNISGTGDKISSSAAFTVNNNLTVNSGNLIMQAANANYTVVNNLQIDPAGTLTHSVDWSTGRMLRIGGNISIDGSYNYSAVGRAHVQMYGTNKTVKTGTTELSILSFATGGAITANGTVSVNDNLWAMYNTTGSFSTGGNIINAKGSLLVGGGTVNVQNGGVFNVAGGITVGTGTQNGVMSLSAGGTLNTDGLTLGDGTRTGTFNHSGGTANIGDLFIRSSCAYTCSNSPLINISGDFTNNGTFTPSTGTVVFNGVSEQTIGGSTATTLYNLTIDKQNVAALSNVLNVSNVLTLTNGVIQLGDFSLTMTNANPTGKISGSFGSTSMVETNGTGFFIVNNVNSSRPNVLLPIGSSGYYAPFNLVSTGNATNSNISVRTVSQFINANFVSRYWDVVSSAPRTATMEFTYDAAEANGAQENYTTWTKTGLGNWILSDGSTSLGSSSFTVTGGANNIGITSKSFTAGAIGTYYSYQSGAWNDPTTWTTDPGGTTQVGSSVPAANDVVVILVDREVSLTASVAAANIDVLISEGAILNMGTFAFSSGLKALRGQGKLKLATASFPNATTNTLVQNGGGTVEYTAPLTLPSGQSYNHLEITSSGVVLQTSNISVLGNLTVNSGTYQINDGTARRLQLSVDGDLTVKNSASMVTGTGNTNQNDLSGGTAPFIDYYDLNSHRVVLNGNFTNNGTVRFTNQVYPTYNAYPTNGFATVYFMGTTDNLVYCGGQTDFHNLVLDKGTDQSFKLTIQSTAYSNFRLFGRNDQGGEGGGANPNLRKALWIRTGSLVLQGLLVIPSLTEGGAGGDPNSDFYIPANGALILDGPEVVVLSTADDYREVNIGFGISGGSNALYAVNKGANASSFSIYGKFQINNGYFSTRESGGFITWDITSGQFLINGGTIDAKQFRAAGGSSGLASYEQSGGTFLLRGRFQRVPTQYSSVDDLKLFSEATLSTTRTLNGLDASKGTFNVNAAANVFNMSGGTIRVYDVCGDNPFAVDVFAAKNNINVTGGSLEIVSTSGSGYNDVDYTIRSNAPIGNLKISRSSGTSSALLDSAYPLTVVKNLEVVSGVLNTQNTNVTVGGNIRFYNGATYASGIGTLTLNGADDQQFRIDLASALTLNHLRIEKSKYFFLEFAGAQKSVNINGDLTLENAELKDNGNVLYVKGNVSNSGIHSGAGRIHLNGSVLQTIGGSGEYGNISLENTNAGVAPVSLSSNLTINGTLSFINNKLLNILSFNLRLSASSSVVGNNSTRYILSSGSAGDGGVTKEFNSNNPFVFPVGVGAVGYTPATLNINGVPNTYGAITVIPVAYAHPNVTAPGRSLKYFWGVKSEGFDLGSATVSHSYNYLQTSVVASGDVTENGYVAGRFNPALNSWTRGTAADVDENTNVVGGAFLTNVGYIDGDYTAGDDSPINPFGIPVIYYSRRNGFWDQPNTWSLTGHGVDDVPATSPGASDIVIIGSSHKVDLRTHNTTINNGVQDCASLQIEAGATLDVGYNPGSNFRLVRSHPNGNGLIRITTSYTSGSTFAFPSGDFSDFNKNLGTTELYSTNSTSGTTYWLPNGVKEYGNLTISPAGGSNIIFPNNDVVIQGNCTIKGQNADSWFCPTWSSNYPTAPVTRVSKIIHVKGNMDIQGGSFGWYGNNGGGAQGVVVDGDVIVAQGAGIDVWSPNTSQSLSIGGSLINNSSNAIESGTSTRSYVNLALVPVTFFGTKHAQITNSKGTPRTDFNIVVVNKGTSKDTRLTCNIGGVLNTPIDSWLTIQNGTFEYVRTGNLSVTTTSAFTIPSSGGLLINSPSEVLIGNASNNISDLFLNGKLTVLNGDVYIGPKTFPNNNNDIEYSAGGAAEIELTGGRLIVNGQIRRNPATSLGVLKYSQSGSSRVIILGNSALATNAKLEIANSGSSFSMSDNSQLIIARGGGTTYGDLYIRPETSSVTGGEIVFSQVTGVSTVDAVQNFTLDANVSLNDLSITGKTTGTARNATVKLLVSPLVLKGNLTLSNNRSIFDANSGFNINVTIGGDLDNNGTYNHYSNTTTFSGGVQSIKGTTNTDFYDLVVNPVTSLSVIRNVNVTRNATISSGTLILGDNNMNVNGNFTNNSTYSTSLGSVSLNGSVVKQLVSGTGTYGRLELNNSAGARLLSDLTLQGNLRLMQGILDINQYLLTLGVASSIEGTPDATRMIVTDGVYSNKGVKKVFSSGFATTFVLPVGFSGKYTPATLSVTANSGGAGFWRVNPVNSQHPSILAPYRTLKYYWDVETSGLTGITGSMQLVYLDTDVQQNVSDEANYVAARLLTPGTSWSKANPGSASDNVNESVNTITFTYSSSDNLSGEYTAGVDEDIPNDIPVYRTVKDGNWSDPTVWEQVGVFDPALPAIPNGFIVQIDHDVAVNLANIFAYRTTINSRLKFLAGFGGHNIGNVDGVGTLYVESSNFPAGKFSEFLGCGNNGVLEYGGINKNYTINANLFSNVGVVKITGSGIRTMPDKSLTFCKQLIFDGPTINMVNGSPIYTILGTIERYNSAAINATNGVISFSGGAPQYIGGITGDFFGANALNRIQINNPNGVTLLSPTEVRGGLDLAIGLLHTSHANPLLISATSNSAVLPSGGRSNSYVNGPLVKRIVSGDSFQFPIGKDNVWTNKLRLSNSLPGTIDWTAEFFMPNSTYSEKMGELSAVDALGYYRVGAANGSTAVVNLTWDANSDVTPLVTSNGLADMRVVRYNTSQLMWEEVGSNAVGGNSAGTVSTLANETIPAGGYAEYAIGSVNSIKPKIQFNSTTSICGLNSGLPLSIVSVGAVPFNYSVVYSINNVNQAPVTITSMPYTIPTPVAGSYKLVSFTYNNGTRSGVVDNKVVSVYEIPTTALAGPDQSLCGASSAVMSANEPIVGVGVWSVVSGTGGSFVNPTLPSSEFNGTNGSGYVLRWTISNGTCTSTDDVAVAFPLLPIRPGDFSSGKATVCQGETGVSYSVPVIPATTFHWSYSGTGVAIVGNQNSVALDFGLNATSGILSVYTSNGCGNSASRSYNITVNETTPVSLISDDIDNIVCHNLAVTFTATKGAGPAVDYQFFVDDVSKQLSSSNLYIGDNWVGTPVVHVVGITGAGCRSKSNEIAISTNTTGGLWTGIVDGDWSNTGNWCSGLLPQSIDNVVIGDVSNAPVVSGSTLVHVDNLSVNHQSLTVKPGARMTVSGNIIVAPGADLIIEHDLGGQPSSFILNGTSSGNVTVKVHYPSVGRNWYLGHSVKTSSDAYFSAGGFSLWSYAHLTTSETWVNEVAGTQYVLPTQGFIAKNGSGVSRTVNHLGELYTGNQFFSLKPDAEHQWNLVANPFNSYLNPRLLNFSNIESTIWYRTVIDNQYQFVTYNQQEDLILPYSESVLIAPMQAFWIKATNSGSLVLDLNALTHPVDANPNPKLKSGKLPSNDVLYLELRNDKTSDQTAIACRATGHVVFSDNDSEKKISGGAVPNIYSIKSSKSAAINILPQVPDGNGIPLGYSIGNTANKGLAIRALNVSGFLPEMGVYLEDRTTGVRIDLRANPEYAFTSDPMTNNSRFVLKFEKISTGVDDEVVAEQKGERIRIYGQQDKAIVLVGSELLRQGNARINIYNLAGSLMSTHEVSDTRSELTMPAAPGIYLVEAEAGGLVKREKVLK